MTLSTHVLDLERGRPAAGVPLQLWQGQQLIFEGNTNDDGRCPALAALTLDPGVYRLEFRVAAYQQRQDTLAAEHAFLDLIPIQFGISATDRHLHVPLLLSPFGYSTYRGS